ncbi:MAG: gas vesicle protein GvpJ [Gemmatimonadaceae bacterium]
MTGTAEQRMRLGATRRRRRMDGERLSNEEVERLGLALAKLNDRMGEFKRVFGLSEEELVIAGDIKINLANVELLTIQIRLLHRQGGTDKHELVAARSERSARSHRASAQKAVII